jgi:tripeptide aminopeptidase
VREWASLHDMAAAAAVIVRLAEVWTQDDLRAAAAAPRVEAPASS